MDIIEHQGNAVQEIQPIAPTVENLRTYLKVPEGKKDTDLMLDLEIARQRGLNPFTGEMYYAQDGRLAVTKSGEGILASRNPKFEPPTTGLVVLTKDGELVERKGAVKLPTDKILGAWSKVESLNYESSVSFYEYYNGAYVIDENCDKVLDALGKEKRKTKSDGKPMGTNVWDSKPATMIRKVALTHALRECFPQVYSGIYDESESGFMETANQTPQATQTTQQVQSTPWTPSAIDVTTAQAQQIKQVEIEEF